MLTGCYVFRKLAFEIQCKKFTFSMPTWLLKKKNKLEINKYKFKQARVGKQAFLGV